MRFRDTLNRKEQSCHQDHEGLYERVTHHLISLFYHIGLHNTFSTPNGNVFRFAAGLL